MAVAIATLANKVGRWGSADRRCVTWFRSCVVCACMLAVAVAWALITVAVAETVALSLVFVARAVMLAIVAGAV